MLKNIFLGILTFVLIGLLIFWIIGGGPGKLVRTAGSFAHSIGAIFNLDSETEGGAFKLPWQPDFSAYGPDLSQILDTEGAAESGAPAELAAIQEKYDEIVRTAGNVRSFGNPSPYYKQVRIMRGNTGSNDPAHEYIEISAAASNEGPISLSDWTLQSILTGVRVPIGTATRAFSMGDVSARSPVTLDPGALAIVTSGVSPVGASLRENICTGYLAQFQTFTPPLGRECPSAPEEIPATAEHFERYGNACFEIIPTLRTCEFPTEVPTNASAACRQVLRDRLSYNGCVLRHSGDSSFLKNIWRIFLGSPQQLWRDSHDGIRLLDAQGQTVDVLIY